MAEGHGQDSDRKYQEYAVFWMTLVVGSTDEEHDERLKQVLERLSQRGASLRKDKCVFGKREIRYLGNVVDHQGLRPTTEMVMANSEAHEPSNLTELK